MRSARIIFSGGGTGGHLFPAIAIAEELKKLDPRAEILFVGTKDKIEAQVVPDAGYTFRSIWISGFRRGVSMDNILFPLKVGVALMQAKSIIREFKPSVVVGTGGYVSGPVVFAATLFKLPTIIQEQNSYPGFTTRLLARRVNEVHITFEVTKQYLGRTEGVYLSGNPTRSDLENVNITKAFNYFGFNQNEDRRTVLIFGGSLGATTINNAVDKNLDDIIKNEIRLIWQTGKANYAHSVQLSKKYPKTAIWVQPFIDRMDYAYAVSNLVVCRSGATTIAELTRLGKPAILVPYPHATANHQTDNAKALTNFSAAVMLNDNEVSDKLLQTVLSLFDDSRLKEMSERSKQLGKPDAGKIIAERVLLLAEKEQQSKSTRSYGRTSFTCRHKSI